MTTEPTNIFKPGDIITAYRKGFFVVTEVLDKDNFADQPLVIMVKLNIKTMKKSRHKTHCILSECKPARSEVDKQIEDLKNRLEELEKLSTHLS